MNVFSEKKFSEKNDYVYLYENPLMFALREESFDCCICFFLESVE